MDNCTSLSLTSQQFLEVWPQVMNSNKRWVYIFDQVLILDLIENCKILNIKLCMQCMTTMYICLSCFFNGVSHSTAFLVGSNMQQR